MTVFKSILATVFLSAMTTAWADTIAIIGSGNVATALGPQFARQGHEIVYGSRDPKKKGVVTLVADTGHGASAMTPAEAVNGADIVVLAIPGMIVEQITKSLGDLSGKIIIDPTNPTTVSEKGFKHSVATSNAEIIQAAAPSAFVVKAFNTLTWRTMVEPGESGGPVSIPLVGNDEDAKDTVAQLVEGMGLEAVDLGGIENARWVEGMLILWINNRYDSNRQAFDFHLRKR